MTEHVAVDPVPDKVHDSPETVTIPVGVFGLLEVSDTATLQFVDWPSVMVDGVHEIEVDVV